MAQLDEMQDNIEFIEKTIKLLIKKIGKLEEHIHYQDMFGGGATGMPVFPIDKNKTESEGDEK